MQNPARWRWANERIREGHRGTAAGREPVLLDRLIPYADCRNEVGLLVNVSLPATPCTVPERLQNFARFGTASSQNRRPGQTASVPRVRTHPQEE